MPEPKLKCSDSLMLSPLDCFGGVSETSSTTQWGPDLATQYLAGTLYSAEVPPDLSVIYRILGRQLLDRLPAEAFPECLETLVGWFQYLQQREAQRPGLPAPSSGWKPARLVSTRQRPPFYQSDEE